MKRPLLIIATIFTFLGTVILIWFLIRGFYYEKFIDKSLPINLTSAGTFGDFVGGFIGTIFAFVGLLLLYETLSLQRKEFAASKDVFVKQQFDNTFFELLGLYRQIVEDIEIPNLIPITGKNFFESEMLTLQNQFVTQRAFSYNRKTAIKNYMNFYVGYKNITSVYFKTLYRIYSLIDSSDLKPDDKKAYSKILRAQLSESELFFIRYNAMTDHGKKSAKYINKYNFLKHLSHFELLEFKDWWVKLTPFERNGLDYLFKEIKEVLKVLIENNDVKHAKKKYKSDKYILLAHSETHSAFQIELQRDTSKNNIHPSIVDGFDKFTNQEIENLLECIIKELIISSNFNQFNDRKNIVFHSETVVNGTISTIKVGVKNKKGEKLKISFNAEK